MTAFEISARRPVWMELSDFYLDTEFDDDHLRKKAVIFAQSPYTVAELRKIELWEVAPVVVGNMLSVAGEWSAFDENWIHSECEKRARRRSLLLRVAVLLGFGLFVRWDRSILVSP